MSLPSVLNTRTEPFVPNTGPKLQAFGWKANEAESGSSRLLLSATQRQGGREAGPPRPSLPLVGTDQGNTFALPWRGPQEAEAYASFWGLQVS